MEKIIRWYQNPHWYTKKDYVKGVIRGSSVVGEEFINSGTYYKGPVQWSSSSNLREVLITEIQQYLPDGHPDKLSVPLVDDIAVTTEAELKEDNYVEIIRGGRYGGVEYREGEIWKIVRLSFGCDYNTSGIYVEKDGKETQLCLRECKPVKTAKFEAPPSAPIPSPVSIVDYTGRYLKALKDCPESISHLQQGQYARIRGYLGDNLSVDVSGSSIGWHASINKFGTVWELMPEGFDPKVSVVMSKINLLEEEATRRFPVGSSFIPAHTRQGFVKVESGDYFKHDGGEHMYLYYSNGTMKKSQGPNKFNSVVYYGGTWAEPVSTPPPVTIKETVLEHQCDKYGHKVGGYVKFCRDLIQFRIGDIVQIDKVYEDGDFEVTGSRHRWLKSRFNNEIIWLGMERPGIEKPIEVEEVRHPWKPKVGEWVYDDNSIVCLGKVTTLVDKFIYAKWYDKNGNNLNNSGSCSINQVRKALPHEITVVEHPMKSEECFKEKDHRLQIPDAFPLMQMKTKKVKNKLLI